MDLRIIGSCVITTIFGNLVIMVSTMEMYRVAAYFIPGNMKGFGILHQERRGQVNAVMMERFNSMLFGMSRPANKQNTNQSTDKTINK